MKARISATLKFMLRIGLSACLLAWLISKTEPDALLDAFLNLSPIFWGIAFLMFLASQVISSIRWYFLAHALDFTGPWSAYLRYCFVGLYFNLFLPTCIGGDVLKVHFISRGEPKKLRATYSVLADRFFGLAAMLLLGAGAVLIGDGIMPRHFEYIMYLSGICVIVLFAGLPMFHKIIGSIRPEIGKRLAILLVFWEKPKALFAALSLSLAIQALGMSSVVILAKGLGLSPPPAFYFAAFPMVAILTILPISFNGIGIREGGFIFFLGLKGISTEKALTLSLSFFAIQIAASLIGGLAYAFGSHKKPLKDYTVG